MPQESLRVNECVETLVNFAPLPSIPNPISSLSSPNSVGAVD
jgi:hypothetical protein